MKIVMRDTEFVKESEKTLYQIAENIESVDTECMIDVDLHDGILTLETDQGVFVVNRQSAAKEIWLSSPISGPYHFVFQEGRWKTQSDDLLELLSKELNLKIEN
jgi:iron donor protein CyaY